jgi:hypothetical protein
VFWWADLVAETVASVAVRDRRIREALPVGFLHDGCSEFPLLRERLRELLGVLAAEADSDEAILRLAQRLLSNYRPVPDGHFRSLEHVQTLGLDTVVERRTGMRCRVVLDENRVKIHYTGNILVGPSAIEAAPRRRARRTWPPPW